MNTSDINSHTVYISLTDSLNEQKTAIRRHQHCFMTFN